MNDDAFDPNDSDAQGGQPPAGYTRVEKIGKKYAGSGKKVKGKQPPGKRGPSPWAGLGTWMVGLGLPVLLVYFMVQKLFVEKTVVSYDPYPPVKYEAEQMEALKVLGQEVAGELTEGRRELLQRRVLWPEVTYRVGLPMKLQTGQQVLVRDTIHADHESKIPGLFRQIFGGELERAAAQLVRLAERDGYPSVIVRVMPTEERVLYYEMLTVPVEGKLRIVDIYDFNRGMFASDAVRREVIRDLPTDDANSGPWKAIYGEKRTKEELLAIKTMLPGDILHQTNVLDNIASLPEEVQNSREGYSMAVHGWYAMLNGTVTPAQLAPCRELLKKVPESLPEGSLVTGMLLAEVEQRSGNPEAVEPAVLLAYQQMKDPYLKVRVAQARLAKGDVKGAQTMTDEAAAEDRTVPELVPLKAQLKDRR